MPSATDIITTRDADTLRLEVAEPGIGVEAADLFAILVDALRVLGAIDRAAVGEDDDLSWQVVGMSVNSPARVDLVPVPRKVKNRRQRPQLVAIDRLRVLTELNEGRRLPHSAKDALGRINKRLKEVEGRSLSVSAEGEDGGRSTLTITAKTLGSYLKSGVKPPPVGYASPTTQVGTLAVVKFTVPRSFRLEDPLTGEEIECRVAADLFDEAVSLGGRRVEVEALAHYNAADRLTRLDVRDIHEMPDDADLPSFDDLPRLSEDAVSTADDLLDIRGTW